MSELQLLTQENPLPLQDVVVESRSRSSEQWQEPRPTQEQEPHPTQEQEPRPTHRMSDDFHGSTQLTSDEPRPALWKDKPHPTVRDNRSAIPIKTQTESAHPEAQTGAETRTISAKIHNEMIHPEAQTGMVSPGTRSNQQQQEKEEHETANDVAGELTPSPTKGKRESMYNAQQQLTICLPFLI